MLSILINCCGNLLNARYHHEQEDITLLNITQLVNMVDPFSNNNRMRKLSTTVEDSTLPSSKIKWIDIYSLDKIPEHDIPDDGTVFNVMINHGGRDADINCSVIMGFHVFSRMKINMPTNEIMYNYRYHINRSRRVVWYITLEISK